VRAREARGGGPDTTAGTRLVTRSFACRDGTYLGIHTGAVGAFGRLMEVLGLAHDIPPSSSGLDMGSPLLPGQLALLERELPRRIAAEERAHWVDALRAAEVCAIEHLEPCAVFDQPQARHNEMVVEIDDPLLGRVHQVAMPAVFPSLGAVPLTPAPPPGRHTADVLGPGAAPWSGPAWDCGPATPGAGVTEVAPLDGLRILDLGAYFAGPYSSRLLADLGAEVVKLEPLAGDQLRGIDQCFFPAQAGKSSVAMNLKDEATRPAVEGLLAWADVVHHNLRPGAAERLGLGAAQVQPAHRRLVYLYAPGWGSSGPDMLRQSFAPMMSGYVGVSFEAAGRFNEPLPSPCNEDPGNGMVGAACILMALLHRDRTNEGLYVENPQLNAAMFHMAHVVRRPDGTVVGSGRLDPMQYGFGPLERLYQTADGWICLAAIEPVQADALRGVLGLRGRRGRADGGPDPDALADLLAARFAAHHTAVVLAALEEAGVPAVEPAAHNAHAFLADPENRRTGRVAECPHPTKGNVRELAVLVRVSPSLVPPHRLAPGLGAQTDAVLAAVGSTPDQIAALAARGAILSR
jgi:crotonobetainyl-CoA:carnitine CoA-transferase CaiB-like acyl-CoA transferase